MPKTEKTESLSKSIKPKSVKAKTPVRRVQNIASSIKRDKDDLSKPDETKKSVHVTVVGVDGKSTGRMSLPSELFDATINKQLLSQAVRVHLANQRAGNASTKTRGQVEGSTRKIYRQKGTGKARHGAIRAPIFVGGGIVFGPKPRDYSLGFPKKMRRAALASALTSQLHDGNVIVVDGLEGLPPKTKEMARTLSQLGARTKTLLVTSPKAETVVRAARNIESVDVLPAQYLHTYAVLVHQKLVFMKDSIGTLKNTFVKTNDL